MRRWLFGYVWEIAFTLWRGLPRTQRHIAAMGIIADIRKDTLK